MSIDRKSFRIGDPIEVRTWKWDRVPFLPDSEPRPHWRPATVCGLDPLSVAFSDSTKHALHKDIEVRRPRLNDET